MQVYRMTRAEIEAEAEARAARRRALLPVEAVAPERTMQEGRRERALNGNILHNGKVQTRRAVVDEMKQAGAVVVCGRERRLQLPNGNYLAESQIGKTAMDYAAE
jgi:hypothetical protein